MIKRLWEEWQTLKWMVIVIWRYQTGRWHIFRDMPLTILRQWCTNPPPDMPPDIMAMHELAKEELRLRERKT